MDEKVTVNLGVFLLPSPALAIPSPARTIPFPPVNKLPNKLAPKVPKSISKNPPLCSLVSFLIVLLTPLNKIPEFSNASITYLKILLILLIVLFELYLILYQLLNYY